ncbi:hypothetical protein I316_01901 [Kwoniella heveanensis BCC8398]|uniref:Uncharacterized protein n=1 Tax=Kwoniella heveanensis BCC8398 TaxID=1296120 RepID=A0A1B9H031_9TREE|nr:hypothetical protein I316_01901 [Kwoniella heveanensis BCC8398]
MTFPRSSAIESSAQNPANAVQIQQAYANTQGRSHDNERMSQSNLTIPAGTPASAPSAWPHFSIGTGEISIPTEDSMSRSAALARTSTPVAASGGEIIGHTNEANRFAAASFKAMLEEITSPIPAALPHPGSFTPSIVIHQPHDQGSSHENANIPPLAVTSINDDILSKAFQREYSADWRARGVEHVGRVNKQAVPNMQDKHLLIGDPSGPAIGRAPSVPLSVPPAVTTDPKEKKPVFSHIPAQVHRYSHSPFTSSSSQRLRLDGLGKNRSRNGYGRNNAGGQELGKGVIGNIASSAENTTVVVTEAGCDIPMIRDPWSALPVIKKEEREDEITPAGTHAISLDPDLPPLAVEHPARMWNAMIHSLSTNLQPIIKWDYEKVNHEGKEKDPFWLAHMTLALPLSHPVIVDHPLFRSLPKNQYKKEYVSAIEALGGIRRYTGDPKKLKADAINTTLVRCIADDALTWIRAPHGMRIVTDSDQEDDDHQMGEGESDLKNRIHAFNNSQATIPMAKGVSDEINIDEEDLGQDIPLTTNNTDEAQELCHDQAGPMLHASSSTQTALQRFMQILDRTLGKEGLNFDHSAIFTTAWNPIQDRYGCTLTVGVNENTKIYQEACVHSHGEHAQETVCQTALELNVEGFMEWLKGDLAPSEEYQPVRPAYTNISNASNAPNTTSHRLASSHSDHHPVIFHSGSGLNALAKPFEVKTPQLQPKVRDWFKELQNFCLRSLRPRPVYGEQVLWHEGQSALVSQISIGKDNFTIT